MPLILGTNSIKDTGYNVANSLRFDDGSSDFLSKTFSGSPANAKIFTISIWTKKSENGVNNALYGKDENGTSSVSQIYFDTSDRLRFYDSTSGSAMDLLTSRKFRDPSAWYHIVWSVDSTQSTASDRVKLYVNGVQETSFDTETYVGQNASFVTTDNGKITIIGVNENTSGTKYGYYNGYMSEFVFIDGSQLAPTSFGEFDEDSPTIWKPKDVSALTFGTNGFYLDFEDSSALGNDVSGNNHDFTANNLTSVDQSTDTCTNNFATLNPLLPSSTSGMSEGNLKFTNSSSTYGQRNSTFALTQGKWYFEAKITQMTNSFAQVGVQDISQFDASLYPGRTSRGYAYASTGSKQNNNSYASFGDSFTTGDIIGMAVDFDNNKIYFSKNGTYQNSGDPTSGSTGTGSAYDITTGYDYCIAVMNTDNTTDPIIECNFGSPPYSISSGNSDANGYGNFEYAVPSGYYALNTKNLAEYG